MRLSPRRKPAEHFGRVLGRYLTPELASNQQRVFERMICSQLTCLLRLRVLFNGSLGECVRSRLAPRNRLLIRELHPLLFASAFFRFVLVLGYE
jgi:hypothetical protein